MTPARRPDNWLGAALGKEGAPQPPDLASDRIKGLISRALLQPGDLDALEVQELAASALSYLVKHRQAT